MGPTWPFVDVDLRDAIDRGVVPGPRLQMAGNYVSQTGGAGDARQFSIYVDVPLVRNLADGPDEIRKAVRTNLKHGADFIKILATGAMLSKGISPEAPVFGRGTPRGRGRGESMGALRRRPRARNRRNQRRTARRELVGAMISQQGESLGVPKSEIERERKLGGRPGQSLAKALQAGLPIGFGTDAGVFPHGLNSKEFALRAKFGESPMHGIQSATKVSAEILGWSDRVGTISPGKFADIIAVSGDPLKEIIELERVKFVMKGGVIHKNNLRSGGRDE